MQRTFSRKITKYQKLNIARSRGSQSSCSISDISEGEEDSDSDYEHMDPEMKANMRYYVNLYLVSQIWPCGQFLLMNFVLIIVHETQNQFRRILFITVPFNILVELLD